MTIPLLVGCVGGLSVGPASLLGVGRSQAVPRGRRPALRAGRRRRRLHRSCTSTWTRSSPSVEVRRRPELRGRPVVVGGVGPARRGQLGQLRGPARTACAARCRPRRPGALCPHAVFLPPDFAAYAAASRAVMEIFRDVTPLVEPLSLDEAFLDVAGARRLLGRPAAIAAQIRAPGRRASRG